MSNARSMTNDPQAGDPQPAHAWAVLVDCPTPTYARKAVREIVAAEYELLARQIENGTLPVQRKWLIDAFRNSARQLRGDA